jgi:hypothetical protein
MDIQNIIEPMNTESFDQKFSPGMTTLSLNPLHVPQISLVTSPLMHPTHPAPSQPLSLHSTTFSSESYEIVHSSPPLLRLLQQSRSCDTPQFPRTPPSTPSEKKFPKLKLKENQNKSESITKILKGNSKDACKDSNNFMPKIYLVATYIITLAIILFMDNIILIGFVIGFISYYGFECYSIILIGLLTYHGITKNKKYLLSLAVSGFIWTLFGFSALLITFATTFAHFTFLINYDSTKNIIDQSKLHFNKYYYTIINNKNVKNVKNIIININTVFSKLMLNNKIQYFIKPYFNKTNNTHSINEMSIISDADYSDCMDNNSSMTNLLQETVNLVNELNELIE